MKTQLVLSLALLAGCNTTVYLDKLAEDELAAGGASGALGNLFEDLDSGTPDPSGSGGSTGVPLASQRIDADSADILFVVDNSCSMAEEQAALAQQLPRLIRALTTGDQDLDGSSEFQPIKDLHLAVVSSDMGLAGVEGIPGCDGLGDDGLLKSSGADMVNGSSCAPSFPSFIGYEAGVDESEQVAQEVACLASLGTDGCGFEQQLEASLKALWPAEDRDPLTGQLNSPNRILFVGDPATGLGATGHGDGANAGFLRNDPDQGLSMIAVVVVTDEEDCSSRNTSHFTPNIHLDQDDPLTGQDLNLRCFYNEQNLYRTERYVNGLRALRPGQEHLVMFALIAGVPPELVNQRSRDAVDFSDSSERDAYYSSILADPRMQEMPDPTGEPGTASLTPSCTTGMGRAYPPRRLVEVAQGFGDNGIVQSICQADFQPAIDAIVARIGTRIGRP